MRNRSVASTSRVQEDLGFAVRLAALKDDPAAAQALIAAAGFEATPDEIRETFLEVFGAELSEDQYAAIAGGMDPYMIPAGDAITLARRGGFMCLSRLQCAASGCTGFCQE